MTSVKLIPRGYTTQHFTRLMLCNAEEGQDFDLILIKPFYESEVDQHLHWCSRILESTCSMSFTDFLHQRATYLNWAPRLVNFGSHYCYASTMISKVTPYPAKQSYTLQLLVKYPHIPMFYVTDLLYLMKPRGGSLHLVRFPRFLSRGPNSLLEVPFEVLLPPWCSCLLGSPSFPNALQRQAP